MKENSTLVSTLMGGLLFCKACLESVEEIESERLTGGDSRSFVDSLRTSCRSARFLSYLKHCRARYIGVSGFALFALIFSISGSEKLVLRN